MTETATFLQAIKWSSPYDSPSRLADVVFLDQTILPRTQAYVHCTSYDQVIDCIKDLVVRGAPNIGVAGAFAMALAVRDKPDVFSMEAAADAIIAARPTAVNLEHAVRKVLRVASVPCDDRQERAFATARLIYEDEASASQQMADHGADIVERRSIDRYRAVITICNTGTLAAPGRGTALGVIHEVFERGNALEPTAELYISETRPLLQGARLTTFEAEHLGIPHRLIVDGAVARTMCTHRPLVVVGADRIAANGDVINKIGTLNLALAAKHFMCPFFVVAPTSTIDFRTTHGSFVPIEERDVREVTHLHGLYDQSISATDQASNPAFDLVPANLISYIVTEHGAFAPSRLEDQPSTLK